MPNIDDIEDVIIGVAGYNFYQRLVAKHGQINVLFYGALFLTIAVALFAWGLHGLLNSDASESWSKVKAGDKLYAANHYFKNHDNNNVIYTYQLVKPITASDIDTMQIPNWQKVKMKSQLDTTLKPQLIRGDYNFWADSLYKTGSAYIGSYISKDSIDKIMIDKWYVVKLNFLPGQSGNKEVLPEGYIYANRKLFYVDASEVQLQEATPFLKQSKKHD
ncbi:hypothetical protein [Mucilaginibacter sp.]